MKGKSWMARDRLSCHACTFVVTFERGWRDASYVQLPTCLPAYVKRKQSKVRGKKDISLHRLSVPSNFILGAALELPFIGRVLYVA